MKNSITRSLLLFGVFFLGVFVLLTQCQKKEQVSRLENNRTNNIKKVKTWFASHPDLNKFVILDYIDKLNWDKIYYQEKEGKIAIEIPLKLKKGMAIAVHDTVGKVLKTMNRLAFVISKGEIQSYYELIVPKNASFSHESFRFFDVPNDFSGLVLLNNQATGTRQYKMYNRGKIMHFKSETPLTYYYCWRIVQVYSDGTYEPVTGWICDVSGKGGNSGGHGGGGGSNGKGNGKSNSKPCPGDPVKNPEIAEQLGASGLQGGEFGCTRNWPTDTCGGVKGKKGHNGLDIKNAYGNPDYAMYDGTAVLRTQYDENGKVVGAGYYVDVTSVVNGVTIHILYFHMQKDGRVSGHVNAGDIIGYQGASGNLEAAIDEGSAVSHVHIKVKVDGKAVDPEPYFATKFGTDGTGPNPCGN